MTRPRLMGGGSAAAWNRLVTSEQASNSISDPGAITSGGTGLVGNAWTWVTNGADIVQNDGVQKNWAGWSIPILTLLPDFNPDTDLLELGLNPTSFPLSTAKFGFAYGIVDTAITTRGTLVGEGITMLAANGTTINAGWMGATAQTTGSMATGSAKQLRSIHSWGARAAAAGWTHQAISQFVPVSGDIVNPAVPGVNGSAMSATLANWRLFWGLTHVSTVAGSHTLAAELWYRRNRIAARPFPA